MTADELKALQTPLKNRYKDDPAAAAVTLKAEGLLGGETLTCTVRSWKGPIEAGLHPAAGGDGSWACSGEMLLEALVACAGVTLKAVATAMSISLQGGTISAEGELDFRGTLGVSKEAPVGFKSIRLSFSLDSDASPEQLDKLVQLTERYCVIYQTLKSPAAITVERGE
ncbi:MAG: OsmC family peroxiredoxin [Planctomycetaceae bacterium]|nr:OsmC family peroxiredoxin [Planctomycetaceae bacterium]